MAEVAAICELPAPPNRFVVSVEPWKSTSPPSITGPTIQLYPACAPPMKPLPLPLRPPAALFSPMVADVELKRPPALIPAYGPCQGLSLCACAASGRARTAAAKDATRDAIRIDFMFKLHDCCERVSVGAW